MQKQTRWAMTGVILCGFAMALGGEPKAPEGQEQKLSPEKMENAKSLLSAKSTEIKALRDKANQINKNIGELASSGKLLQEQAAVEQMKLWVEELADINERLARIEEEIEAINAKLEGRQAETEKRDKELSKLLQHKFSNYVQFQYVGDSRPGQSDSFRMRRVRIGFTEKIDPQSTLKVSFDLAGTQFGSLNEPAESAAQLRDAFLTYQFDPDAGADGLAARLGRQPIPLGHEIERSSSEREFPERSLYNQALFPGERSTGITLSKGLGEGSEVEVGLYNALTYNDPQQRTSGAARGSKLGGLIGFRHKAPRYEAGISYFKGERETLVADADGTTIVNPAVDREFLYIDGVYHGLFDDKLFVRGEAMFGQDRMTPSGSLSGSATVGNELRDVAGHQVQLGYNLDPSSQLNLRYQVFDRDTSADGDAITGWGLAYIYYLTPGVRLTAAFEEFNDPLRAIEEKYQITTVRVQFKF